MQNSKQGTHNWVLCLFVECSKLYGYTYSNYVTHLNHISYLWFKLKAKKKNRLASVPKFLNKCGNLIYGYSIKTPFLCRVKVKQIYLTLQICWGT